MRNLNPEIKINLEKLPRTIDIGYGSLEFFTIGNLPQKQIGYARDPEGQMLDSWNSEWLVIGQDASIGDPVFLDIKTGEIFTAMHGQGYWNPKIIANSLETLADILKLLKDLSDERENPVKIANNPISEDEEKRFKSDVMELMKGVGHEFWTTYIECVIER